jgi:hypothetical protein
MVAMVCGWIGNCFDNLVVEKMMAATNISIGIY